MEKDISETDKYGRLPRYVYVDDIFVNADLIRQGLAWAKAYEPNTKYQDYLEVLEAEARQAGPEIWALTQPQIPMPSPPPTGVPNAQITFIFYDGPVPRVESDEYVEITNFSDQPQDLAGWVLKDITGRYPSFTFPS